MKKSVYITDEDLSFLKSMAKRDGFSLSMEIQVLFDCEVQHWRELYEEELKQEGYLK